MHGQIILNQNVDRDEIFSQNAPIFTNTNTTIEY